MDAIPAGILEFQYAASREGSGRRKTENMKSKQKTKNMVLLALFGCIEIVLMLTPLVSFRSVGAGDNAAYSGYSGRSSDGAGSRERNRFDLRDQQCDYQHSDANGDLVCFSPFYSVGEFHGGLASLIIAIGPRVLLGWLPAC